MSEIKLDFAKRFRDPIYGFIKLTQDEVDIIDTPIFQRLRRIHQLALQKYVYPTAEHSRFVHSLGVLQCAHEIFERLYAGNKEIILETIGNTDITTYCKTLRFAALLHDIGHLPFSHAVEEALLGDYSKKHEDLSELILLQYDSIRDCI